MSMWERQGWSRISCEERNEHYALAERTGGLSPVSSLTDPDGNYGSPVIFTEWGRKDSDEPLLRDYRYPVVGAPDSRPCVHYFYVGIK